MRNFSFFIFILLLSSCAKEANFRGVPQPQWQKLTAEQRQLIVDQSYEEELHGVK
jgi:hypothetical protein